MENVKKALRDLSINFDYNNFLELLNYIDTRVELNPSMEFDEEFLHYFNIIMSFVNDNVKEDGEFITLGNALITQKLINHEKLSPTLIIYYYLNMKEKIGLRNSYNKILFQKIGHGAFMCVSSNQDLSIDYNLLKKQNNIEKFNYETMRKILHELVHIYQYTRTPNFDNEYDAITYYDAQITTEIQKYFDTASSTILHESLATEWMADEISITYMLEFAKKHPELFSTEFINQETQHYIERHNDFYKEPRKNLDLFLQEQLQFMLTKFGNYESIKPLIESINQIKFKQNSFDKIDFVYNIFLNSVYSYNQNKFMLMQNNDFIEEEKTFKQK